MAASNGNGRGVASRGSFKSVLNSTSNATITEAWARTRSGLSCDDVTAEWIDGHFDDASRIPRQSDAF
ncbi:unnamed protein product [Lampetra planeri]